MSTPTDPMVTAEPVIDVENIAELVTDVENKANDEPLEDTPQEEEQQDAAFVQDTGDETATLTKPRKPTVHHRGHDIDFENEDFLDEGGEDDLVYSGEEIKYVKLNIASASLFTLSSLLYLAMSCMIIDYYWFYREVPRAVYWADDDSTWWNYFINCTEDGFLPEDVENADDDYTWTEWYNNSAFAEDDIVWLPSIANENAPGIEPYVTKYMMLYFWAALGFVFSGSIDSYLIRQSKLWIRAIYCIMIFAALWGFVSAILTNKSPFWSNICNCVSVNLWALESIVIVMARLRGHEDFMETEGYDTSDLILGWSIKKWFWVADISFLIGTWGDAISSYWYVFERDNYIVGILAIIFAFFWLLCALIYLGVAIYDYREYKSYMTMEEEYYKEIKEMEIEDGGLVENGTEQDAPHDSDSSPDEEKKPEAAVEQAPEQAPEEPPVTTI